MLKYNDWNLIVTGTISATTEAQDNGVLRAEGKASRAAEKDPELKHAQQCKRHQLHISLTSIKMYVSCTE